MICSRGFVFHDVLSNSAMYRFPVDSRPPLEEVEDEHLDRYITSTSLYLSDQLAYDLSGTGSETPTTISTVSYGWSDATLTGSLTGRSSFCSWGGDVGVSETRSMMINRS